MIRIVSWGKCIVAALARRDMTLSASKSLSDMAKTDSD